MIVRAIGSNTSFLSEVIGLIDDIQPSTVELVVIPVIIFEAAFFTDWCRFKKEIHRIIPMATSVVIISSVFTAIVFQSILRFDYSWNESLLLGFVVNASDHVVVKARLKDIHLNEQLETLLEGETLLNQATILVLFRVVKKCILEDFSFGDSLSYFCRITFGGFSLGILFAISMGFLLKRFVNDYLQETNITLVTTFLLFWICSSAALDFSGAVAIMTLGLYMAAYGKILITPSIQRELSYIWFAIANYAQSLVFIMAGMILERLIIPGSMYKLNELGYVIALFIILHVIRGLVILIHYPILKYFGYGFSLNEIIVLTIADLKGVISSALVLISFNDTSLNEGFRLDLLFATMTIITFSIYLDSFILKRIIHRFHMDEMSNAEEKIILSIITTIIQEVKRIIERFEDNPDDWNRIKWQKVLKIAGPKIVLEEVMKTSYIGRDILLKNNKETAEKLTELYYGRLTLTEENLSVELRQRFFGILREVYWNNFITGQCRGTSALELINSCNKALNKNVQVINDWQDIQKIIYNEKTMKWLNKYTNTVVIGRIIRRIIYDRIINAYDIAQTFVRAYCSTEMIMRTMEIDFDKDILTNIIEEANEQIQICQDFIKEFITDTYPEIISDVQSKMACFTLLNQQRRLVDKVYDHGVIKLLEYRHLSTALDENLTCLTLMKSPKIMTLAENLKKRFKKSSHKEIEKILPYITEKHFQPDFNIFESGSPIDGAYLIFSGTVNERNDTGICQTLGISNIAGSYALTEFFNSNYITTASTLSVVIAAYIPANILLSECFLEDIYKEAIKYIILDRKEAFGLKDAQDHHIEKVVEHSNIWYLNEGSPINLRRGALVIRGNVMKNKGKFSLLRPSKKLIESIGEAIILIFPSYFGNILKQHRSLSDAFASYYIKHRLRLNKDKMLDSNNSLISNLKIREISITSDFEDDYY